MPIANQKYAFVTVIGWESLLSERWPNAPLVGGYRLLVFAGSDLPRLKVEYSDAKFKELSTQDTIEAIEDRQVGHFICSIEQSREVCNYFAPPEDKQV